MAHWICKQCGTGFKRDAKGKSGPSKFCSQKCYRQHRKDNHITTGQFSKGLVPWNKNRKGIHLSPTSEFKPGSVPANKVSVGAVKLRTRRRDGKQRAWVKTAEPNTWMLRARVVWEEAYGPLPKGLLIHHIDRDTLNDSVTNLAAISRAAHLKDHRHEFENKRRAGLLSPRRNPK